MRWRVITLAGLALACIGCEPDDGIVRSDLGLVDTGPPDSGAPDIGAADSGPSDVPGAPQWYTTCGDPVCKGYTPPAGVAPCTSETLGEPCAVEGEQCDPMSDCNALLVCATSDPKQEPGGCPISRRALKTDIVYLGDGDMRRLADEVLALPLATWRYRDAPGTTQLGFVLEDVEPSLAADSARDRVNLYAFATMAVAALRVQDAELRALRAEVEALRGGPAMCR